MVWEPDAYPLALLLGWDLHSPVIGQAVLFPGEGAFAQQVSWL